MNYKLLMPTYRARQTWALKTLDTVARLGEVRHMINVGCGEGDIDHELRERCARLVSCDLIEGDVGHALALNANGGSDYVVADAQRLPFNDGSFDVACCFDVIEHVADPHACLRELARIVRAGGHVVLTCPNARFPATYDPINWILSRLGTHVSIGAFGYGHDWLVVEAELIEWASNVGLRAVDRAYLTKPLAAAFEAYWATLAQRFIKANKRDRIRPSRGQPPFLGVIDGIRTLDERLFARSKAGVTLGFLFERADAQS
jgi:2-polyprenyl-3-methyl-5-hydroxy-6-metoxy-1,4-benzoquinol methylase